MKRPFSNLSPKTKRRLPLVYAFCLPFFICLIAFACMGAFPFGDRMILAHDGWHQYFPFLVSFREKLLSGGNLQYTWDVGMGMSYLSLYSYYLASPLYLLCVLVPKSLLSEFYMLLTMVKLSLASLFFAYFLRTLFRRNDWTLCAFSLMYAFCAWAAGYYWNIMWLDVFALLPLLIAGTVSLLRDARFRLYVIALALSLWSNYYIAFFCCIFVALFFFAYCICKWNGFLGFLRRIGRAAVGTILGVGMAAVLLVPTLYAMQHTYSAIGSDPSWLALNIAEGANGIGTAGQSTWEIIKVQTLPGVWNATRQVLTGLLDGTTATKMSGLPNIFSGMSAVVLALYFFCCRKVSLREKFISAFLLVFFVLSFIFRRLDYYWHGMHFPNMLPYRFSFLFSFVLITMAYRAFTLADGFRLWHLAIIVPLALAVIVNGYFEEVSLWKLLLSLAVIVLGVVFFLMHRVGGNYRVMGRYLLCLTIALEMSLSLALGAANIGATVRSTYPKEGDSVEKLLKLAETLERERGNLFWRAETDDTYTLNEGALLGYHGVSTFTSSANAIFNRFSGSLGFASWPSSNRYAYIESSPFTNTLCGIRYLFDRSGTRGEQPFYRIVETDGKTSLVEYEGFLSLGFMTNAELANFTASSTVYNPFTEQEQMFRQATGITKSLYFHLNASSVEGQSDTVQFYRSGNSGTQYSFNTSGAEGDTKLRIRYKLDRDGLVCMTSNHPTNGVETVSIYCNDTLVMTRNIKIRALFNLGAYREGDVITLEYSMPKDKSGAISADVAVQNDDVLSAGLETLADECWKLTEFSDTRVSGTIDVLADGLFYTSVPYEPGWTAYVDGEPVALAQSYDPEEESLVALTDAVIAFPLSAGSHTVTLEYHAPGLKLGAIVSGACLLVFVLLVVLLRKRPVLLPDPDTAPDVNAWLDAPEPEEQPVGEEAPWLPDAPQTALPDESLEFEKWLDEYKRRELPELVSDEPPEDFSAYADESEYDEEESYFYGDDGEEDDETNG